jgi:hypothetical protein
LIGVGSWIQALTLGIALNLARDVTLVPVLDLNFVVLPLMLGCLGRMYRLYIVRYLLVTLMRVCLGMKEVLLTSYVLSSKLRGLVKVRGHEGEGREGKENRKERRKDRRE